LKTTNTIFQVPAGKTWLVIKLLWRAVELTKPLSTLEIHKTRGDGSDPIMLHSDTAGHVLQTPSEGLLSLSHLQNVVVDNEEMLRQVVEGPNDVVFVVTYDMSVLEMTAV
jgi:hypothetical protein